MYLRQSLSEKPLIKVSFVKENKARLFGKFDCGWKMEAIELHHLDERQQFVGDEQPVLMRQVDRGRVNQTGPPHVNFRHTRLPWWANVTLSLNRHNQQGRYALFQMTLKD